MGDLLFPSGGTFDRRAARSLLAWLSTAEGAASAASSNELKSDKGCCVDGHVLTLWPRTPQPLQRWTLQFDRVEASPNL